MKYGLSESFIDEIKSVFETYPKVNEVIIFGSRANGDFKTGSDIDLAIKGNEIRLDDILNLSLRLENITFPYKMDLINLQTIEDTNVIEHINRVGKVFYKRAG
ncbi:MAG: nucleotidyltransferase domain-containing protein [bacterium]|nr:nucleotidyltransferase domain-containing protein [bacterium]